MTKKVHKVTRKKVAEVKQQLAEVGADTTVDHTQPHETSDVEQAVADVQGETPETLTAQETQAAPDGAEEETPNAPPAPRIKSLEDIEALPEPERLALTKAARTSARAAAGLAQVFQTDETGAERRDTMNRRIPAFTPRRPADVVAADELLRLKRLPWAQTVRARCKALAGLAGAAGVTEDIVLKAMKEAVGAQVAPKSYLRSGGASKQLWGRVVSYMAMTEKQVEAIQQS